MCRVACDGAKAAAVRSSHKSGSVNTVVVMPRLFASRISCRSVCSFGVWRTISEFDWSRHALAAAMAAKSAAA
jgi:hypothetical protein